MNTTKNNSANSIVLANTKYKELSYNNEAPDYDLSEITLNGWSLAYIEDAVSYYISASEQSFPNC